MNLDTITTYLDGLLKTAELPDYAPALNGMQVENSGEVRKLAAAVDLSEATIRQAIERGCNLIVVHHGLFWDGPGRISGRRYRRLKLLFDNDIAVYAAHLPLDVHPEFGNNALLTRAIGATIRGSFGSYQGLPVGVVADLSIHRDDLKTRLEQLLNGPVKLIAGGPEQIERIGVVTGSAASMIGDAVANKLDAFVTGEGAHHTYFDAMEFGINVYYGGHYATETFGVRALTEHLSAKFNLSWEFIDLPTGL